jgi:hypothetical protein
MMWPWVFVRERLDKGTISATTTSSGFTAGKLVVVVDCSAVGGVVCTAKFDLAFAKQ